MTKPNESLPVTAIKAAAPKGPQSPALKRRSSRVAIDMPVMVFGQQLNGKVFSEETRTSVVSAHGALIVFTSEVQIKPSVLLVNKISKMEAQCRVVSQKDTEKGKSELGLEFVDPQPRFWGIAFPPEDWNNADRKMPGSQSR